MAVHHEPTLMDAQSPMNAQSPMDAQSPTDARSPRAAPAPQAPASAPIWLQRMSLIVLVLFCFYIGGLLAVLPWSPRYWDRNAWLLAHPTLDTIIGKGWVRGLVSGIGLLDIWVGISELLHYRDHRG